MSDNSTVVLSAARRQVSTGLQVVILGDVEVGDPWADELIELTGYSCWNEHKRMNVVSGVLPLVESKKFDSDRQSDLLRIICLKYPFWNDFRILDFFNKRGISMTMEQLQDLRRKCDMKSREDVCLELMQLYFNHGITLDKRQVQFIERLNPAFRDRDFVVGKPGDLLVYQCIFFRRLHKMFYIHLIFDLYNGYAFGKVSRLCSGEIGLKLLQEKIDPFYRGRGYKVNAIVHSIKSTRDYRGAEEASIRESVLAMGIEWLEPKHEFGIIQRFERDFLEHFFSDAEALDVSLLRIQPAFDRLMIKYNAACPFHQRRNLLGYRDCPEPGDRMHWEAECN